jgi:hypothetical protein
MSDPGAVQTGSRNAWILKAREAGMLRYRRGSLKAPARYMNSKNRSVERRHLTRYGIQPQESEFLLTMKRLE